MGLTNRTQPIAHHIMPLVINGLGVDTQTDAHIHTHAYRHANKNNFKKLGVCSSNNFDLMQLSTPIKKFHY